MRIGIDISQLAYPNTGVANYVESLVQHLLMVDGDNEYVLFYSSLRRPIQSSKFKSQTYKSKFKIKSYKFPPKVLDLLWNKLHIAPIEWFIGDVDVFITSDWTEPPAKNAKKATIIHDLTVYTHPQETYKTIQAVQKRKLKWVQKESDVIFTNSQTTKQDVVKILGINENKIKVAYPGI